MGKRSLWKQGNMSVSSENIMSKPCKLVKILLFPSLSCLLILIVIVKQVNLLESNSCLGISFRDLWSSFDYITFKASNYAIRSNNSVLYRNLQHLLGLSILTLRNPFSLSLICDIYKCGQMPILPKM